MKGALSAGVLAVLAAGCASDLDPSYAPGGGTKTIVPFPIHLWQAPVTVANHLFYDPVSRVRFDVQIASIDGKTFADDRQRTKFYYQIDPGPHVIVVRCELAKVTWVADFDFLLDPGDSVEITGELIEDHLVLWFADVKTGRPVSEKITAIEEGKKTPVPSSYSK